MVCEKHNKSEIRVNGIDFCPECEEESISALSDRIIKPCPFCGGEARTGKSVMTGQHAVLCKTEDCKGMMEMFKTENEAIEAWNKRAL